MRKLADFIRKGLYVLVSDFKLFLSDLNGQCVLIKEYKFDVVLEI